MKGKKQTQADVVSTTASVARPRITSFFEEESVASFLLLIPMSGGKTREYIQHKGSHCTTLMVWKKKGGFNARLFDPKDKNSFAITKGVCQILTKIKMESDEVPILHGRNKYVEGEEGHCFALAYEFVAKVLDGDLRPKTKKAAHVYDLKTQKYTPVA